VSFDKDAHACDCCDLIRHVDDFSDQYPNVCLRCLAAGETPPSPSQYFLRWKEQLDKLLGHEAALRAELAGRTLARRRLIFFVQKFFPKYMPGWVHEDIARRLERFVKAVEEKKSPRLLINTPPRLGKSTLTSHFFPAWLLGQHPEWEIIAASHTQSLALSFSRKIRDLIRDPAYQAAFPDCKLDPDSQAIEGWLTTAMGGYLAAGVGSGITGRGAHVLLIDDPVKDQEAADSAVIRENTWDWYTSTAYTRVSPGGGIIGILTRWHDDDWGGRIEQSMDAGEGDQFEIVKYPAINEGYDEYMDLRTDKIQRIFLGTPAPSEETHRLLRPAGSALHPDRYDLDHLIRIKKNLYAAGKQRVWSALYQQDPAPDEGAYFDKSLFRYYVTPPQRRHMTVYQAWDFAISEGEQNDFTVGVTIGQDEHDNLYVLDIARFKSGDSIIMADIMLDLFDEHKADIIGVEDGQIWRTLDAQFKKRCGERRLYPTIEVLKPLTDKLVRASPLKGRMQLGKVMFAKTAPWFDELEREMLRFPAGKHDDQIDGLSWAVRVALNHAAPTPVQPKSTIKSWRDRLGELSNGSADLTHMSA